MIALPEPYVVERRDELIILALSRVVDAVRSVVDRGTLFDYAERAEAAAALAGRGTAWRVPAPPGSGGPTQWLVRHYRRGGLVAAPLLGDRYLAVGPARPVREIRVSHEARQRGVSTPEVLAGVIYPAGPFYRADLATAFIPDTHTLADLLFGEARREHAETERGEGGGWGARTGAPAEREAGCRAAGRAIRTAHDAGLVHRDLNLRNILLQRGAAGFAAYLLDLDAAWLVDRAGGVELRERRAMLRRFWRSAGKFERKTRQWLADAELEAFEAGYAGDG